MTSVYDNGKGSSNWLWSICVHSVELCVVRHTQLYYKNKQVIKNNNLKQCWLTGQKEWELDNTDPY